MREPSPDMQALRKKGMTLLRPCTRSLMDLAAGNDPHLSEPAVVGLGKIGDPVAKSVLAALFEDDQLSAHAVEALNRVDDPSVVATLLDGSRSASPRVMAACAAAFEPWAGSNAQVLDRLRELTQSGFSPIRSAALKSLAGAPQDKARPILLQATSDDDPEVVVVALATLARVGAVKEDGPALEALFDRAQDPKVRATLIEILGTLPEKAGLEAVRKGLRDPNPRVRANAVEALGKISDLGDRRKIALLKPMIQEGENNRVLANIAIALGDCEAQTSVQILSKLLNSTEKWERASAVFAARHVKNDRVASWLTVQLTSDDDPDVLRNILGSLEHFSSDEVTQCFLKALSSANPLVRSGAAKALGGKQDLEVENALVKLLETEGDQAVLCEVIRSLGRMCDSSRIGLIARQLQHTDLRVQATAIEALAEIGTPEVVPHVEPFVNSTDNRVKANAAVAMWNTGNLSVLHDLKDMLASPSLKQRSSAVYAIGEVGESLRKLDSVDRYFLLTSALEQEGPPEEPGLPDDHAFTMSRAIDLDKLVGDKSPGSDFPFETIQEFFAQLEARDPRKAVGTLEAGLSEDPANPYLNFLKGDVSRRQRDLGKACEEFRKVSEASPEFLNAHHFLGNIHQESKEIPQSLEAYFRAVAAELAILEEYTRVGLELLDKKKVNEASLLLKDLLARVPLDAKAHMKAGLDFLKYKAYPRAFEQLAKAYTTRPASGELKVGLAYSMFKTKQYRRSRVLCEAVLEKHADDERLVEKARSLLAVMDKSGV